MTEGKIPPQSTDIEKSVLGAILIDRNAMQDVVERLRPEMFYVPAHQMIYEACYQLYSQMKAIDIMTVPEQLKRNGTLESAGGVYYLIMISKNIINGQHITSHSLYLEELYLKRSLISVTATFNQKGYEDTTDVFKLIDGLENALFQITQNLAKRKEHRLDELYYQQIKNIEAVKQGELPGVYCGISDIDNHVRGFKNGNLIILAGRPGSGKSALVTTIAKNTAFNNFPTVIFSLEMTSEEVTGRISANINSIPLDFIVNSDVRGKHFETLMEGVTKVKDVPLYIDDTASITLMEVRSKLRRLVHKYGIKLAVIDYLQLMGTVTERGKSRESEVSELSKGLKSLAKELGIPIIALSQLSRAVESRSDKRPMLSDLRESGSIEQDADMVCFLYRPEYYNIRTDEQGMPYADGYTEFIISKYRSGKVGIIPIKFIGEYTKFINLQTEYGVYNETNYKTEDLF